jgi:hypothetical protein
VNTEKGISITVTIKAPWGDQSHSYRYVLDPIESEAFCKLPRDREFNPFELLRTQEQLAKRTATANSVGRIIASALINYVATKDPYNGYERKYNADRT